MYYGTRKMNVPYDTYYQTANLFGEPYPELLDFFTGYSKGKKVLDLGCGQGRDAIPLARIGFVVTGVDNSKVGIAQMNEVAKTEQLQLKGIVADIFKYDDFKGYDFVLLDSMFHFAKKDVVKETELIKNIISATDKGSILIFCVQDTGIKVNVLTNMIQAHKNVQQLVNKKFNYIFKDNESGHISETKYCMLAIRNTE